MIVVDSNVLIDVLFRDPAWYRWSSAWLALCAERGEAVIIDVIFAEICLSFRTVGHVEEALAALGAVRIPATTASLFRAAPAFRDYRRNGGAKTDALPDFFIGAYADTSGLPLLTRDLRRYRTCFPDAEVIAP